MHEEYQPGLELSNLRIALQRYQEGQKVADEERAKKANLIKSSASLGKSVYDYWAMDQQSKYKDLLSQEIDNQKIFEVSPEYRDSNILKKMFTPASERVDMNPAYQKALNESKPKIPLDDLDLNEWSLPDTEMTNPDTFFMDDIPLGEDDVVSSLMREGLNTAPVKGGPMTASLGLNDSFMTDASGVDLLSSSDDAVSATGVSSKLSGTLGLAGTALSAYDLATNWDDMSGAERAQGTMKTVGGGMMATGIGAVPGAIMAGIGTIWDLLD